VNRSQLIWLALPLTLVVAIICLVPKNRERTKLALASEGRASLDPPPPPPSGYESDSIERTSPAVRFEQPSSHDVPSMVNVPSMVDVALAKEVPRGALELELVSSIDGSPIRAGHVELGLVATLAGNAPERILRERTDPQGKLRMQLEPGALRIVAWGEHSTSRRIKQELASGQTLALRLELMPARAFGGFVIDAETSKPIQEAVVRIWTHNETDLVRTGLDGTFEHPRFPAAGRAQQVHVKAPGYGATIRYLRIEEDGRWKALAALEGQPTVGGEEDPWIEIALVPERRLSGRVLDARGRPVPGANIAAVGFFRVLPAVASRDEAGVLTDENGRFELRGLRSDISHILTVAAAAHAEFTLPLPLDEQTELDVGDILLRWEATLCGIVHDATGEVLKDALVRIAPIPVSTDSSPARVSAGSATARIDVASPFPDGQRTTRTDSFGAFQFEGLPTSAYRVSVERDAGPLIAVTVPDSQLTKEALNIRLPAQYLSMEGLVEEGSVPIANAIVKVHRYGHVATTRTDTHGRFRVSGLDSEGPYEVSAKWTSADGSHKHAENRAFAHEEPVLRLLGKTETKLAQASGR